MNTRLPLAGIPCAFAAGAVAARLWLQHVTPSPAGDLAQPLPVVTAWGVSGAAAFAILSLSVLCAALAPLALVRAGREPGAGLATVVVGAAAAALIACLAWPFVFSSDVYAYAAYGDMALHGLDPYRTVPAGAHDAFIDAARRQWGGTYPVCVYGPVFVGFARLAVGIAAGHGVGATLLLLRAAAGVAFVTSIGLLNAALEPLPPRRRCLALCAYGLNPTLIWSAAEGHNDAYLALAACAAAVLVRRRLSLAAVFLLALTPVLKASGTVLACAAALHAALVGRSGNARALLALGAGTALGFALALPPLLPALAAVGAHGAYRPASLQALIGVWPAVLSSTAAVVYALLELVRGRRDGFAWLGIAVVVALPNVYPWYGLWLAPLALVAGGGYAAAALWGATISAIVRYLPDATGQLPGAVQLAAALAALPLVLAFGQFAEQRKKAPVHS